MSAATNGNDTVVLNNQVLADFADGNAIESKFPNEIASVKTGKNGNAIYGQNLTGQQMDLMLRIVRGTNDDKFLNNLLSQQNANLSSFPLMFGQYTKVIGNSNGGTTSDTYVLSGGIFVKNVEAVTNVEGDAQQSVAVYTLRFANAPRILT